MQSPIVHGARQSQSTYTESPNLSSLSASSPLSSDGSSWSQALLESPVAADLIALSPNKRKSDVFPTDLPPKVLRHAIAEGFSLDEIVAVLYVPDDSCSCLSSVRIGGLTTLSLHASMIRRGLQAQMKDINDVSLVVKTLYQRAPLMRNPWKSERVARHEAHPRQFAAPASKSAAATSTAAASKPSLLQPGSKGVKRPPKPAGTTKAAKQEPSFITENLLESIPGGMNASIARIVQIAAIKSFDPDADAGDGAFVLAEDFTSDPFQSYLQLASPLLKVRPDAA